MVVENGKLIEISENELFKEYLSSGFDLFAFKECVEEFKKMGVIITEDGGNEK